jgi:hypothetical protein
MVRQPRQFGVMSDQQIGGPVEDLGRLEGGNEEDWKDDRVAKQRLGCKGTKVSNHLFMIRSRVASTSYVLSRQRSGV